MSATRTAAAPEGRVQAFVARPWAAGLCVFGVALAVRLVFLAQSTADPTFQAPVMDSARYDHLARLMRGGTDPGAELFWQAPFYPVWLSGVYRLTVGSIPWAKGLQLGLGALTALLAFWLGRRLLGGRTGLLAGLLVAAYGPLVYFEGELLAEGWAAFLGVALVLLLLEVRAASSSPRGLALAGLLGLAGGLAILTRPTFLPFSVAALAWLAWARWRDRRAGRGALLPLAAVALAAALPLGGAAWLSARSTGQARVLPLSGGLNLYLGNQPDLCRGLTLRPGAAWDALLDEAEAAGAGRDAVAQEAHFRARVWAFLRSDPGGFLAGLGAKAVRFASGREIPRNTEVYTAARFSPILGLLAWKAGGFGFPFGLVLPLAVLGLALGWRRFPAPVWLWLSLWPAAVVLVFVADRYRLPIIPVLAVPAAWGLLELGRLARARAWRALVASGALVAGVGALAWLPGPFCEEQGAFEAELHLGAGAYHQAHARPEEAAQAYWRALALRPDWPEAHVNLGVLLLGRGELPGAELHLERALALELREVHTLNDLAWLLLTRTDPPPSAERCARALALTEEALGLPGVDRAAVLDTLSLALSCAGRPGDARRAAEEALALARAQGRAALVRELERRLATLPVSGFSGHPPAAENLSPSVTP